ncbi:MAG: phosphoglycerate kinase [Candidatus Bathyarchaeota archaeon]|nr:phosphoglycerate kinase [Candidatus Bathyarchaeota archaeon]
MVDFLTLDEFDFTNKTALVRVDFNSPLNGDTQEITDDTRIRRHAETIKELMEKKARVVILAHQGRLGGPDYSTLEKHAERLRDILKQPVGYVDDVFGEKAQQAIRALKPGDALVLNNVRGFPGETAKKTPEEHAKSELVTNLAPLADVYVGDGFAVAHRSQASVVGFSGVLPCVAGRIMERELRALGKVRRGEEKPCIYVLGGAKAEDGAAVCEYVLGHGTADYVLAGGVIGHLFLHAKGVALGEATVDYLKSKNFLQYVPTIQNLLTKYPDEIQMPVDFGVDVEGKREDIGVQDLPTAHSILDIGSKTVAAFSHLLEKAKIIVLSGPMGVYERDEFMLGTKGVFENVAKSTAFSVTGGGNTIEALEKLGLTDDISYISTGGGALMEYLIGKTLPGVQALRKKGD